MALDEHFLHSYDKCSARVLVELNVSVGLPTEIDIISHDRVFFQRLDYLKVPFRCHFYHETDHIRCSCPSSLHGSPRLEHGKERMAPPLVSFGLSTFGLVALSPTCMYK